MPVSVCVFDSLRLRVCPCVCCALSLSAAICCYCCGCSNCCRAKNSTKLTKKKCCVMLGYCNYMLVCVCTQFPWHCNNYCQLSINDRQQRRRYQDRHCTKLACKQSSQRKQNTTTKLCNFYRTSTCDKCSSQCVCKCVRGFEYICMYVVGSS